MDGVRTPLILFEWLYGEQSIHPFNTVKQARWLGPAADRIMLRKALLFSVCTVVPLLIVEWYARQHFVNYLEDEAYFELAFNRLRAGRGSHTKFAEQLNDSIPRLVSYAY